MRESHKSKRLSWASDVNLCQVRLFLSEESPSQVGLDSQDHLQAKTSWLSHSSATPGATEDVLPPGFEASLPPNHSESMLSQIPTIKWKSPPRFSLELTWQVVAGEESNEAASQNQREMRVLEAIYPRPSAIPPNPSVAPSTEELPFDDAKIPSIPITAIEDEDAEPVASSSSSSLNVAIGTDSSAFLAAALSGLANNNEQGNTINRELLLKLLSNPILADKLAIDYGTITTNNNNINNNPPPISRSTMTMPQTAPSGPQYPQPDGNHYPNPRPAQHYLPPNPQGSIPAAGPGHKDFNYYKSLIQQHGGERQDPQPPPMPPQQYNNNNRYNNHQQEPGMNGHNKGRGESKLKVMRPCVYFNSSRGCRHGANCSYQHDPSYQHRGAGIPEVQTTKRTKFDREISS